MDCRVLNFGIEKMTAEATHVWNDEHPMVAFSFEELIESLKPYFEVHVFEHDYKRIIPWDKVSENALLNLHRSRFLVKTSADLIIRFVR